jgi:hypothetical protein
MDPIARRAFLGVAGLSAVAAGAGAVEGAEAAEYGRVSRPIVTAVGRGQVASLTFVWLPPDGSQRTSLKARLALFDLGGKVLAENAVTLTPFSGASVEFEPPSGARRTQLFGYVFFDDFQALAGEVFGGIEVFETSSGRANVAATPIALP